MQNNNNYNSSDIFQCQQFLSELDTDTLEKLLELLYQPSILKRATQNEIYLRDHNQNNLGPTFLTEADRILAQIQALQFKFDRMNVEIKEILRKTNAENSKFNTISSKKFTNKNIPLDDKDF